MSSWPDGWSGRRVLVVVAHPDDEVLGCGALLARLRDVRIVHVTDGAPRRGADAARLGFGSAADYAAARRAEAIAALALAGISADRLTGLGLPDQDAAADLAGLAERLGSFVAGADVVLTHAFEGGHSDHDAVAFAVQAACRAAGRSADLHEMPFYYGDDAGWVRQRFLPVPPGQSDREEHVYRLSAAERDLKTRMIAAHATQRDTLAPFALDAERFRRAPLYDFSQRPHPGPLLYERHGWNLDWATWTERVAAARAVLGLP